MKPHDAIDRSSKRGSTRCGSTRLTSTAAKTNKRTSFAETVDGLGRNAESRLLRKFYLRTNAFRSLAQIPLALRLLLRGRLEILPRRIKGLEDLHKMMDAIEENGTK